MKLDSSYRSPDSTKMHLQAFGISKFVPREDPRTPRVKISGGKMGEGLVGIGEEAREGIGGATVYAGHAEAYPHLKLGMLN